VDDSITDQHRRVRYSERRPPPKTVNSIETAAGARYQIYNVFFFSSS
jgi:hypothetical protein